MGGRKVAMMVAAATLLWAGAGEASTYTAVALPMNDGAYVNSTGVVAGAYNTGQVHALLFKDGVATDLGSLGGSDSRALAINDLNQVVGWSEIAGGTQHAFVSDGTVMTDLGTLGGTKSYAFGINNDGVIVGYSQIADDAAFHAFKYENGVMTDIGPADNWRTALGVNASGQITGSSSGIPGQEAQAYLYSAGAFTNLGNFGGSSEGLALNDAGVVVGEAYFPGNQQAHAFLSDGGPMQDLGTLGGSFSTALDINNLGQVVGWADSPINHTTAFIYQGGQMIDLNTLIDPAFGWYLQFSVAESINDAGQITAHAFNRWDGTQRFYLLTPNSGGGGVPEPATWAMMIVGFGLCGLAARRRAAARAAI